MVYKPRSPFGEPTELDTHDLAKLFDRQLPKKLRGTFVYRLMPWEENLWVEVCYWGDRTRKTVVAGQLLKKHRKYEHKLYKYTTLDPELVAYLCLVS